MEVLRRIRLLSHKVPSSGFIDDLRKRIQSTLRGHLKWLERLSTRRHLLASGCFAGNYWVTGDLIRRAARLPGFAGFLQHLAPDMVTDTPFQILKMTGYAKFLQDTKYEHESSEREKNESPLESSPTHQDDVQVETGARSRGKRTQPTQDEVQRLQNLIKSTWRSLLGELDKLDQRKAYAWPHRREDGVNVFRLDDHFWLWQSLREVRSLGLWDNKLRGSEGEGSGKRGDSLRLDPMDPTRRLLPDKIQRAVIQRFSTDNDVLRTRMLAVTRSPRETRFLFHSRDTALFYGHRLGFFSQDEATKALWEGTVRSQARHDDLRFEESPMKMLRYALGILAGLVGIESWRTTPGTKDPRDWARHCLGQLIEATAQSGLTPGYIGEERIDRLIRMRKSDNRDYGYQ